MNNGLISDFVERIASLCLKNKLYVLPCDYFAKMKEMKSGDSYILNLDRSTQRGSHYVGLYLSPTNVLYFDPLGFPLVNSDVENGLLKHGVTEITYSKKIIQGGISFHCGVFVIAFHIICVAKGKSMDDFISLFSDNDFRLNEKIATNIIVNQLRDL